MPTTPIPGPLVQARFLQRYNRFLLQVRLEVTGEEVDVHMADPGRLRELLLPEKLIWLRPASNPARKTRWSAVLVESPSGGELVSLDTTLPNRLIGQAAKRTESDEALGRLGRIYWFTIEFGVLRAIGLSVGQMITFLGLEQIMLIAAGLVAGTAIGVWTSRVFIPFLQVGTDKNIDIPPFVVLIAWDDIATIYLVFGAMLLGAVIGMIWFLLHLKIFEAVKLGEAV